jgi:hypothetical protein
MTPRAIALVGAASAVVYLLALVVVGSSETSPSNPATAIAVLAGTTWIVAGLIAIARRPGNRTGWLMLAAGNLWALAALQLSSNAVLFTIGVALGQVAFGPWVHLLLAFPEGRLRERADRILVATTYAALVAIPTLATFFDPTPLPDCPDCPASAFVIAERPRAMHVLAAAATVLAISLSAAFIAKLAARYRSGELDVHDVVRRHGVIVDWGTGELFPTTTEQYRAMLQRRSAGHWTD